MPCKRPRHLQRTSSVSQLGTASGGSGAVSCHHNSIAGGAGPVLLHAKGITQAMGGNGVSELSSAAAGATSGSHPGPDVSYNKQGRHDRGPYPAADIAHISVGRPSFHGGGPRPAALNPFIPPRGGSTMDVSCAPAPELPPRGPHFLDTCFLCTKSLGHCGDIFMYRGDRAFCSAECRHYQIAADENIEKCRVAAMKQGISKAARSSTADAVDGVLSITASTPPTTVRVNGSSNTSETATAA